MLEALYLRRQGLKEYSGDALHQPPLLLLLLYPFQHLSIDSVYFQLLFLSLDLLLALSLTSISHILYHNTQSSNNTIDNNNIDNNKNILDDKREIREDSWVPYLVYNIYLLNPFTLFTSLACSTIILNNLTLILSLYFALKGMLRVLIILLNDSNEMKCTMSM